MADISLLQRLVNGVSRNVDISANTPVVQSIKVGGSASNTELTKAILDNLVTLQNGSDIAASLHHHDGRYYTESELSSNTASSGSDLIGDDNTYSNFTPAAATVKGALSGIDTAIANAGSTSFSDAEFELFDNSDNTKTVSWELSSITTGSNRQITMADANVDLSDVNNSILRDGSRSFTANQSMGSNKLTGLADPTADGDAANKLYVDNIAQGLTRKAAVKAATTTALAANTAAGSGVGKTLTADANGALSIDGVSTWTDIDNDGGVNDPLAAPSSQASRVLVKDESTGANNGIYVVKDKGSGSTPWILIRAVDADEDAEVVAGMAVFVSEGTDNGNDTWSLVTNNPITVDTTSMNFTQTSALGQINAGTGLSKTGDTINIEDVNRGVQVNADDLEVDASEVASTGLEQDATNSWQLRLAAQGNGIAGGAGSLLSVQADTTGGANLARAIDVNSNGVAVKVDDSTVGENGSQQLQVNDNSLGAAKLTTGVADQDTITGGNGSALAAQHVPEMRKTFVAGESFAADTTFAVRMARDGETAGRVYKAEYDTTSDDLFYVIGVVQPTSAISAGQNVEVIMAGEIDLATNDTAFAAAEIGQPVHLQSSGAWDAVSQISYSSGQASVRFGMVQETSKILVQPMQLNGVN